MKREVQNWWNQQLPHLPLLASGLFFHDRSSEVQSLDPRYPADSLRGIGQIMLDLFEVARMHRLQSGWARWRFEQAELFSARRDDGHLVWAMTHPQLPEDQISAIEQALSEFLALQAPTQSHGPIPPSEAHRQTTPPLSQAASDERES